VPLRLSIVEPIDEVGCADQKIDVHGPVLAVLEGSKAIEDEGLSWPLPGNPNHDLPGGLRCQARILQHAGTARPVPLGTDAPAAVEAMVGLAPDHE
jgi:hypothetical protein